jgi:unsaturated rhamnogalacturonyl hydrolase
MGDILLDIDETLLRQKIDAVVKRTMATDMTWDWPCGVAFYGISKAYETTGEKAYMEYLARWVDEYLEIGLPPFMVNAVAMGHCLLSLHQATGDKKYLDIAVRKAEYLRNDALRFGAGVFQHTVSAKNDFPGQAWADTLFMAAYFLLRMGRFLGEKAYVDDALNQYYWHEELLQDPKTNLFYHGYDDGTKGHMSGMFWARGNAWASLTMAEALKLIDYTYPMFMQIDVPSGTSFRRSSGSRPKADSGTPSLTIRPPMRKHRPARRFGPPWCSTATPCSARPPAEPWRA